MQAPFKGISMRKLVKKTTFHLSAGEHLCSSIRQQSVLIDAAEAAIFGDAVCSLRNIICLAL